MDRRPAEATPTIEHSDASIRVQYAALGYRWTQTGDFEVLLVTSRRTGRWVVPKGWPIKGRRPWETAEIEAREEAGVEGAISKRCVGRFLYDKYLDEDDRVVVCEVAVYPLLVERQSKSWREKKQRRRAWVTPLPAVALLSDAGLQDILRSFVPRQ